MNLLKLFNLFYVMNYFISFCKRMKVLKELYNIKSKWNMILWQN